MIGEFIVFLELELWEKYFVILFCVVGLNIDFIFFDTNILPDTNWVGILPTCIANRTYRYNFTKKHLLVFRTYNIPQKN